MLRPRASANVLAATNIVTSFAIIAGLAALLSPLADPARIAVADQMRRLQAGVIAPDKFEYAFLRFHAGRFGVEALRALTTQTTIPLAAQIATAQLKQTSPRQQPPLLSATERAAVAAGLITVAQPRARRCRANSWKPIGAWEGQKGVYHSLPGCLNATETCQAILTDLDGDGIAEIILISPGIRAAEMFQSTDGRNWRYLGNLESANCAAARRPCWQVGSNACRHVSKTSRFPDLRLQVQPRIDCRLTSGTPKAD